MPIRKDLQPFYRGPAWRETRTRILARAGNKCEQCGKPNRTMVQTATGSDVPAFRGRMFWKLPESCCWTSHLNEQVDIYIGAWRFRLIAVVLTIAHLNHIPSDDRDENLRAFCQWCHLHYDRQHHKQTRCERKDRARPLLEAACR